MIIFFSWKTIVAPSPRIDLREKTNKQTKKAHRMKGFWSKRRKRRNKWPLTGYTTTYGGKKKKEEEKKGPLKFRRQKQHTASALWATVSNWILTWCQPLLLWTPPKTTTTTNKQNTHTHTQDNNNNNNKVHNYHLHQTPLSTTPPIVNFVYC